MSDGAPDIRRIVTGLDPNGRSRFRFDDSGRDLGGNIEIWSTAPKTAGARSDIDPAGEPLSLLPPPGGSKARYVVIPPAAADDGLSPEQRRAEAKAFFASMQAEHVLVDDIDHPHAHRTQTIDYIVILAGELSLLLGTEERALRPGNVVVQCGTSHAWINRGASAALFVAIMIDARETGP